ncbi:hypothetical protein jhhlp_007491 [Lomentospora prolificans]|uniref:O-methyltransferase C-terminal domain-containing protein n=1 Tax=Lomentospora prolificans TaxID=41688 RepID=A0A2N3N165_9PEZI|nr:hypothetical protein jhhlp_007491 [Lomentospora prolificans]
MANNKDTLTGLAATISETSSAIAALLAKDGLPAPTFAEDSPTDYPKNPDIIGLRFKLIDAALDLYRLAVGPSDHALMQPLFLNHDAMVLDTFNQFDFWTAVPLGGSATMAEISKKTTLPESIVRRFLSWGIASRIFAYGPTGSDTVVHSSLSATMAKKPLLRSWLRHNFQEVRPASVHTPESFWKYSAGKEKASEEPMEAGFALANIDRLEKPESFWEYLKRPVEGTPEGYRAKEFANSMEAAASASSLGEEDLLKIGYDWASLGEATVVDVGGSNGHAGLILTNAFPNLRYIVQDLPEVEAAFHSHIPEDVKAKVSFEARDFFNPQSTKGDLYILKMILHDWPDKYAIKILSPLLPHLKSGARLVLCEVVAAPAEAPLPPIVRRIQLCSDLQMLCAFNSLERSAEQWKALFHAVDPGLEVTHISNIPGSIHNFIEVKYLG